MARRDVVDRRGGLEQGVGPVDDGRHLPGFDQLLEGDQVVEFTEKVQKQETWINGGFFVFEPGVLDYLPGDSEPLEQSPLINLARDGELFAYKHNGFWHPMDTVRDRDHLDRLASESTPPWMEFSREPRHAKAESPAMLHA